jgi:hypothetical protein
MSETLKAPWIADYLINIAETYGSNLTNVPVHIKPGRKVQLLRVSPIPREVHTRSHSQRVFLYQTPQFITFQQHTEDDCVWAYVSDKHQQLPARFSRQALASYSKVQFVSSLHKSPR